MTINIDLSTESIDNAIARLKVRKMHLEEDAEQLVEILTNDGAEVAQSAYGDFPVQATPMEVDKQGECTFESAIVVSGDMPMIAEFGAGDATLSGGFENTPEEARSGSYSELHAKQYSRWGFWYFGGEPYTEVPARHGLLDAKRHIISTATETAMEVMTYD